MKLIEPDSASDLLRATHVLVVRVESAQAAPWAPEPAGGVSRTIEVGFVLEEVVKGGPVAAGRARFNATLRQFGTGSSRQAGVAGVWSRQSIEPGARFVVLAASSLNDPARLVEEPACRRALVVAQALTDVHLAAAAEAGPIDLAQAVALARPAAPALGFLYTDYLWARFHQAALFAPAQFDALASLLEEPQLSYEARASMLARLTVGLTTPDRPPEPQISRYVIALFRVLALQQAAPLHDRIVDTDLPTVLEFEQPGERTARQMFSRQPDERPRAIQTLKAYHGAQSTAALMHWLDH